MMYHLRQGKEGGVNPRPLYVITKWLLKWRVWKTHASTDPPPPLALPLPFPLTIQLLLLHGLSHTWHTNKCRCVTLLERGGHWPGCERDAHIDVTHGFRTYCKGETTVAVNVARSIATSAREEATEGEFPVAKLPLILPPSATKKTHPAENYCVIARKLTITILRRMVSVHVAESRWSTRTFNYRMGHHIRYYIPEDGWVWGS